MIQGYDRNATGDRKWAVARGALLNSDAGRRHDVADRNSAGNVWHPKKPGRTRSWWQQMWSFFR